jgi:hypothetical protein
MYDCDKSVIESLARCVKWNASGGKSGSAFLKTLGKKKRKRLADVLMRAHYLDDRFIAKEMSRTEFQTMETFAPSYFAYMSSAVSANVSPFDFPSATLIAVYSGQRFLPKYLVVTKFRSRNLARIKAMVD